MAEDFDEFMDEEFVDDEEWDWEPSEEDLKRIERAMQDMNDGFGYEWLQEEEGDFVMKCLKCERVADIHQRPFPHKYDCPMRKYYGEKD